MKFRTTRKAVKESFSKVICVDYCNLQNLLTYETPIAYTCGVYGWNANIYAFGDVAIVTGYRPFGDVVDYNLCKEYEKRAKELRDFSRPYAERKTELDELIKEFIAKSIEQ
ncbi:MAG: hypothetical protein IKY94_11715 [Lachnospiraceae bacterium]|nr:hypothetical protein [Lachnospiraceae bacterium]